MAVSGEHGESGIQMVQYGPIQGLCPMNAPGQYKPSYDTGLTGEMLPPIEAVNAAGQNDLQAVLRMADEWDCESLPALRKTLAVLDRAAEKPEKASVQMLSEVVLRDPLMTLKLLATVAPLARAQNATRPETVTSAIVWLGVEPFLSRFVQTPVLESVLSDRPSASSAVRGIIARAKHAGRIALGLAIRRNDTDAAVIYETAVVNDAAEIMLWLHHEELALQIQALHRGDPDVSSLQAQQQVLGFALGGLTRELMRRWEMPRLMQRLADPEYVDDRQVYCVHLGIQMARHLQSGWSHPKMAEDLQRVADLLCTSLAGARRVIEEIES